MGLHIGAITHHECGLPADMETGIAAAAQRPDGKHQKVDVVQVDFFGDICRLNESVKDRASPYFFGTGAVQEVVVGGQMRYWPPLS